MCYAPMDFFSYTITRFSHYLMSEIQQLLFCHLIHNCSYVMVKYLFIFHPQKQRQFLLPPIYVFYD